METDRVPILLFLPTEEVLRDGVVAATEQGIASEQTPHSQPKTDNQTVPPQRLDGVGGAGGLKPTMSPMLAGYAPLI